MITGTLKRITKHEVVLASACLEDGKPYSAESPEVAAAVEPKSAFNAPLPAPEPVKAETEEEPAVEEECCCTFKMAPEYKVLRGEQVPKGIEEDHFQYAEGSRSELVVGAEVALHGPPKSEFVHAIRVLAPTKPEAAKVAAPKTAVKGKK